MRTARSQGHFESLDGLRGAAALAVVIHHSANVYLVTETRNLGFFTPVLHALARLGHPAVLLFFVLSGFVLYVSFLRGHDRSYRSFLAANSDILREFVFSAIIFCICLGGWFDALLRSRPFLFLGRASYSLYLIHLPILFAMTYWLQPKIGIAAVVLIAPVVSVIVARAMYSLIEVPCISAGRTVAGLFARRPLASDFALRESTAVVQSGLPRPTSQ
jgi:peptidoglycan/LPS O-acetylase OafA/YrhL